VATNLERLLAMAYVQTPSTHRRTLTLGAVAALHAAAIYALVSGFAATVWEKVEVRIPIRDYPADPPPPEPVASADPRPAIDETRTFVPKSAIEFTPKDGGETIIDLTPLPQPTGLPGFADPGLPVQPSPSPSATFTQRGPAPLGSLGKWATPDDYPAAALREEREGVARFRVTVGTDGRVRNCEITASSGWADLDRATCTNVAKRARFKPAIDGSGAAVSGSYSSAVKWEIPG
jgi:protein TonB